MARLVESKKQSFRALKETQWVKSQSEEQTNSLITGMEAQLAHLQAWRR